MLKNSHAWFNKRYSKNKALALGEQGTRKNKLDLWASKKPTPPEFGGTY
jgi:hypothetical protein